MATMKFLTVLIASLIVPSLVNAATIEAEISIRSIKDITIAYLGLTNDDAAECAEVCISQGVHLAFANDQRNDQPYFIAGADLLAKITGGALWARWGLGLSFFDRQTERLSTPWALHGSLQSGYRWVACTFHHWSNGRAFAEKLHIEQYWPDKNDGPNAITCGVTLRF